MKKLLSLTVLTAILTGCMANSQNDASYGSDGFGEESLNAGYTATDQSLNNAYLLAPAPKYYIGSAYKVEDVQYIPMEDFSYNQTGIAGIVPTELNGTKTSNGEIFDINQMSATSKTLPLPTIARVTNLDNGQSVVVRVNNRGPFVNTRIMDLSPAAARRIGMNGQSKVQVQVLANESMAVKNATLGADSYSQMQPQAQTQTQTTTQTETVYAPTEDTTTTTTTTTTVTEPAPQPVANGEYSVQIAAFYAQDSADALAARMRKYGNATVIKEGDMYKVRIVNLDASQARSVIDQLRANDGMAPGLLKDGRWVNADSI